MESIQRYGMNAPLVVDAKGTLIVGHTRYQALVKLGATHVPVIRPKLTAEQAKEYRIADNKTGEIADWDKDKLIPELRGFSDGAMLPFFAERDLSRLLAESAGQAVVPVTDERVERALANQQAQHDHWTAPQSGGMIRLECPHCGEGFHVDRATLAVAMGEREK